MTFAFPSLLWFGLPLLAATLAVHLLNLRRKKPVPWAAMDFLLESERQNRTWVNLKEWLLLAVRMVAIALAVFALAGPQFKEFSLSAFRDSRVLHVVVLDDSYSMSDSGPRSSVWLDAVEAVDRVLAFASTQQTHSAVVLRTSQDTSATPTLAEGGEQVSELRQKVTTWEPSHSAGRLLETMDQAARVVESTPTGVRRVAYVVTDSRRRDIEPLEPLRERIKALDDAEVEVRWVRCVASQSQNLAIEDLRLLPGPAASGVELAMRVKVANHGPQATSGVIVQVERDGRSLPALDIGAIAAGETATRQFAVLFSEPGPHRVTARIESDGVPADNTRYAAFELAPHRKVLLLDGSPGLREGRPFAAALRPNNRLNTGWRPKLVRVDGDYQQTDFSDCAAVFLLDVSELSAVTADALRSYVLAGGGLLLGAGAKVNAQWYNEHLLGDAKQPLAGFTLARPYKPELSEDPLQGDLRVTPHPLFKVFAGERDSFLSLTRVNYLAGAEGIESAADVDVLASHVSGSPLMLESQPGQGCLVCLLTSVGQSRNRDESWSNLSALPVFPVLALELAAHTSAAKLHTETLEVGGSWRGVVRVATDERLRIGRVESDGATVLLAEADGAAALPTPDEPGVYQVEQVGPSGVNSKLVAINVQAGEGDLSLASEESLGAMLAEFGVPVETAVALAADSGVGGPSPLPPLLGVIALALLLGEQALAISASYHEPSVRDARR